MGGQQREWEGREKRGMSVSYVSNNNKEPSDLLRTDGKRPDGVTLLPWKNGRCATWDVTVTDTMALSYLHNTSRTSPLSFHFKGMLGAIFSRLISVITHVSFDLERPYLARRHTLGWERICKGSATHIPMGRSLSVPNILRASILITM